MRIHIGYTLALTACLLTGNAAAATYKCTQAGKTIISDLPCAADANRVDHQADRVSRSQLRQAEVQHMRNHSQLRELEYKAERDRRTPGGVLVVPGPASPADIPRRPR